MRLQELAIVFFKQGLFGFGGPAAHIAMMEEQTVKRRQWVTQEQFLDLLAATNLIPGPNSTQMAIHIGYLYAGVPGLIIAGVSFVVPAMLVTLGFAWLYTQAGTVPGLAHLFIAISPAVLVIIVDAFWRLLKKSVPNYKVGLIALGVSIASLLGVNEIAALLVGGLVGIVVLQKPKIQTMLLASTLTTMGKVAIVQPSLVQLGLFFLKIGSVLFGGGYVLFAFLQGEMVEQNHWLTQQQLVDAIAVGQFTPGPILSTATFIGYLILGLPGAIIATVGIFLPSFFYVFISNPLIPKMRRSKVMTAFLDALKAASVALIGVVAVRLAYSTFLSPGSDFTPNWLAIILTIINAVLVFRFQVKASWIILGSLLFGYIFHYFSP